MSFGWIARRVDFLYIKGTFWKTAYNLVFLGFLISTAANDPIATAANFSVCNDANLYKVFEQRQASIEVIVRDLGVMAS